jgi:hypothetical protein
MLKGEIQALGRKILLTKHTITFPLPTPPRNSKMMSKKEMGKTSWCIKQQVDCKKEQKEQCW